MECFIDDVQLVTLMVQVPGPGNDFYCFSLTGYEFAKGIPLDADIFFGIDGGEELNFWRLGKRWVENLLQHRSLGLAAAE